MAHYGWTWQYLLWGIRWPIMQRMMIDAPSYEMAKEKKEKGRPLTPESAKEIMAKLNGLD